MRQQVLTLDGAQDGSVELNEAIFGLEPRPDLLQRVVRYQLAKRRAGTHAVQNRSDVDRSTKKIYKQKGTGNARHGAASAPQFRGGGRAFGPVVRDHGHELPKKVRKLALWHALSVKAKDETLIVVDDIKVDSHKTKAMKARFGKLGWSSALIIGGSEIDEKFTLATRAIEEIDVLPVQGINVYDILRRDKLVLTRAALEALNDRFNGVAWEAVSRAKPDGSKRHSAGTGASNRSVAAEPYPVERIGRTTDGQLVEQAPRHETRPHELAFDRSEETADHETSVDLDVREKPWPKLDRPSDDGSERRLMDAFEALNEREEEVRADGVRNLVGEGLRHLTKGHANRRTTQRLRAIMPALHRALFDEATSVRKAAALAICTLRNPADYAPDGMLLDQPDPKQVCRDLQSYFDGRKTRLLTLVEVVGARQVKDDRFLDVRIRVLDHLPLEFDGHRPSMRRPGWLTEHPTIVAHVGTSAEVFELEDVEPEDDADSVAALRLSARTGTTPVNRIYVDVAVDGRALDRHLLDVADARFDPGGEPAVGTKSMASPT